jgi:hypothetical protein
MASTFAYVLVLNIYIFLFIPQQNKDMKILFAIHSSHQLSQQPNTDTSTRAYSLRTTQDFLDYLSWGRGSI